MSNYDDLIERASKCTANSIIISELADAIRELRDSDHARHLLNDRQSEALAEQAAEIERLKADNRELKRQLWQ